MKLICLESEKRTQECLGFCMTHHSLRASLALSGEHMGANDHSALQGNLSAYLSHSEQAEGAGSVGWS